MFLLSHPSPIPISYLPLDYAVIPVIMPNIMVNASFHLSISYGECHKHMLPFSWNGLCPRSKTTIEDKDPIETDTNGTPHDKCH